MMRIVLNVVFMISFVLAIDRAIFFDFAFAMWMIGNMIVLHFMLKGNRPERMCW